ncbi:NADH-quinone oxidoreductase subunit C [Acidithiobacillus sp. IBUN Pt1247-S3]|uniref:NADH-quinone oxidoreductase subunit C n=1 Tax=Acidithiobacillus sp. IBUN Pt1247-S3 TaxID=3166642 RepID=UPI0034E3E1F2
MEDLQTLSQQIEAGLGQRIRRKQIALGELTLELARADFLASCTWLRDEAGFDQLIDVCGVDYAEYGDGTWEGERFAVVYHLLGIHSRQRLRLRVFLDEDLPVIPSVNAIWPAANWFERETFDLFGFLFEGHPDLRRILTDYGFVGHPFRKDFPLVGTVEMRYDPDQRRVIYEPTRTEERVVVPRIVRSDEEGRYDARN